MVIEENIRALKRYAQIDIQTRIGNASPYELIQMLIDGALSHITLAKGYVKRKQVSEKGQEISKVISIIGGLRDSIDHSRGGAIANNLEKLYTYITQRLVEANIGDDIALLDEVYGLLMTIKVGWNKVANHPEVIDMRKQIKPAA